MTYRRARALGSGLTCKSLDDPRCHLKGVHAGPRACAGVARSRSNSRANHGATLLDGARERGGSVGVPAHRPPDRPNLGEHAPPNQQHPHPAAGTLLRPHRNLGDRGKEPPRQHQHLGVERDASSRALGILPGTGTGAKVDPLCERHRPPQEENGHLTDFVTS